MKKSSKAISIRTLIILSTSSIVFVASIILGLIVFTNWTNIMNQQASLFANQIEQQIHEKIDDFMFTPYHINETNQRFFLNGLFIMDDEEIRERLFLETLDAHEDYIYSTAFATSDGYYYGARINPDGSYEIMRKDANTNGMVEYYSVTDDFVADELMYTSDPYDPRLRDWYVEAVDKGEATYSSVYKHFVLDELTITASWPIYDETHQLLGVLANHVILSKIDRYLSDLMQDTIGKVIIIEKDSLYLIANSFEASNFTINGDLTVTRQTLTQLNENTILDAYLYYVNTGDIKQKWSSSGDTIYFNMIDYQESDVNWVVLTAIPESFFMSNVYQTINITIAIMSIIIVLIFIGYIRLTYMIFKPLEELADMSDQLAEGDFNIQTKTYRDDEVGRLATSFNHMTKTIHSMITYQEEKVKKRTEELEIANKENNQRKEELKLILDTTVEGIFGIDIHGVVTFINKSGLKILGYASEDEVIGKYIHKDIRYRPNVEHNEDISTCMIYQAMKQGMGQKSNDETFKKRDGSIVQVRFASYPQFQNHKIIGAVISFSDNSEEKKRQEEMEYISYHDYLTGLYNRRYFVETFELLDEEKNYPLGIIMVDLNALKLFNDAFGHYSGDKALIEVAKALRASTKEKDVVCRLSGDEFAILVPKTSDQELEQIKINIKQRLADKTVENIMVTVAIGYESKTEKDVKLDVLLSHAENHMYRNKIIEGGRLKNNTINEIFEALITKHPHEKEHAELVSKLSEKMGKALGLKADSVKELSIAGLYHDIGKISISDDILSKQASLSEDEIEQMKKHTEIGYQILKTADAFSDLAIYALSHHENIDGSGYPRGLKGKEIPLFARIIRMIEAYAYMITNRPYHQKITQEEAIKELQKHSNTQFDPELVKVFIKKVILQEK